MNIYEKIQSVRFELESMNIKMSGHNEFAKYDYFELDDFIKPLNELMQKYKMTAYPSFTTEFATLTAVNCEEPEEKVVVTSPMGTASLKGCHEVQNIGAVETYQRRYLYQALFDITEKDGLNATQGKNDKVTSDTPTSQSERGKVKAHPAPKVNENKPQSTPAAPPQQLDHPSEPGVNTKTILHLIEGTSFTLDSANEWVKKRYGKAVPIDDLPPANFNDLYDNLEKAVNKEKAAADGNS